MKGILGPIVLRFNLFFVGSRSGNRQTDDYSPRYMICTAKSLNLSYMIPLNILTSDWTVGFYSIPAGPLQRSGKVKVKGIDGKTFEDILGPYKGVEVGGGIVFAGISGTHLKNNNGVTIGSIQLDIFDIFSAHSIEYYLDSRDAVYRNECLNPYVIMNDTQSVRERSECLPYDQDTGIAPMTPTNIEALKQLRFEKV